MKDSPKQINPRKQLYTWNVRAGKCSHTHTHARARAHAHTHARTHTHTHRHTHKYARTHTHMYTHVRACARAHTHTHTHTYTYKYSCVCVRANTPPCVCVCVCVCVLVTEYVCIVSPKHKIMYTCIEIPPPPPPPHPTPLCLPHPHTHTPHPSHPSIFLPPSPLTKNRYHWPSRTTWPSQRLSSRWRLHVPIAQQIHVAVNHSYGNSDKLTATTLHNWTKHLHCTVVTQRWTLSMSYEANEVHFSSRRYLLALESPYALLPVIRKCPSSCLWLSSEVGLADVCLCE